MSGVLVTTGWIAALAAAAAAAAFWRRAGARMELVARACHEVRGPLTAARLGLHLIGRQDGPAALARVSGIDLELRRAGLALDDLDAARAGRRAADRAEPVSVAALLRDALAAWQPIARALGSDLRLVVQPPDAFVRGDRVRLAQACGNLVANAVEHGRGPIELRARASGRRVRIEIVDAGPGLPAPVAELARRRRGGRGRRGRGLAIAAEIAARHGGRLAAGPTANGARIALELPVVEGAA